MSASTHINPALSLVEGWTVHEHVVVSSTNLFAARLPAWHAVRADGQTAGRGRFQRRWISDEGGLWLSAVVPTAAEPAGARMLPLVAGLAVCQALQSFGVSHLHMRWPNDILVGSRKLAGLLIDQFTPGLAVVGIGINRSNRPQNLDPTLDGQIARLVDLISAPPSLPQLMRSVLIHLRTVCVHLETRGPEMLLPRINALWEMPVSVHLDLDDQSLTGEFEGIDGAGRLQLRITGGEIKLFEPHEVRLLRELY